MNTEQKSPMACFDEVINQVENCIPFNPDWNNGTGYLDKATKDASLNLGKGEMARSLTIDDEGTDFDNRRILIIGLGDGRNIVVFERHNNGTRGAIVSNAPRGFSDFEHRTKSHTSFYPDTLDLILNDEVFK